MDKINHTAAKLLEKFKAIRNQTEKLVAPLKIEDFVAQPVVDVSPPKWHLGHSTWFFENFILAKYDKNYRLYDQKFNYIFNSYYESQGDRILRNQRGTLTRPTTEEIMKFRKHVNQHIELLFTEKASLINEELLLFFEIGLNHEQQHQELLVTDIKFILGHNPLLPAYEEKTATKTNDKAIALEWLKVEEGKYTIGYQGDNFHFDNEKGIHQVYLHAFECMNRPVTIGEYLAFMEDGGYRKVELWLEEGWAWVQENNAEAPFYWFKKNNQWHYYRMDGVKAINPEETLTHINFYEAEAYARWKKARLLTEQEWEVAAAKYKSNEADYHFQDKLNFHPQQASDNQFFGSVWEWTNSAYLPYPFYNQAEGALGEYNGKFMINQMVLRGGSCATPKDHFRLTYRNFFHPHLQWQFTGIRLAKHL